MIRKVIRCALQDGETIFGDQCPVVKGEIASKAVCQSCKKDEDSEPDKLASLATRCRRALDPEEVDPNKESYAMLVLEGFPFLPQEMQEAEEVPVLSEEDLDQILEILHAPAAERSREQLRQAALNYFSNKVLWKHKPPPKEIERVLQKVEELSDELSDCIVRLSELTKHSHSVWTILNRRLRADGYDAIDLWKGVVSLYNATHVIIHGDPTREGGEPPHKDIPILQKKLPDMTFNLLIRELRTIFEEATQQAATYTAASRFVSFVVAFLKVVDPARLNDISTDPSSPL